MISSERTAGLNRVRINVDVRPVAPHGADRLFSEDGEELFVAGQVVPAGTYQLVDSPRILTLEAPSPLPPSFDGRRAEYRRIERPWLKFATKPAS